MGDNFLKMIIILTGLIFVFILFALYFLSKKKKASSKYATLVGKKKKTKASLEVFYQKLYVICTKIPFIRRYTLKLRRKIEILNIGDEYLTRQQTAQTLGKIFPIAIISIFLVIFFTKSNLLLMASLLLLLVFFIETLISGYVDKLENKLLKQQIEFFAEIRHAYHEYNMIEEAIYEVSQNDEMPEIGRQGEKVYEILISEDPETELEKYYDIAPNDFLKEFAGISYLTREFGDRKDEKGASLYLKNLNNITQEMQIEILKRDKLDYMFQSLSLITLLPVLFIEPLKSWAVNTFTFTKQFYYGKLGLIAQILLVVLTAISYVLVRKLKDNSTSKNNVYTDNPWQNKLYKINFIKRFVDMFIPKKKTLERRKIEKLLKDSASRTKIEWLYINKILIFIITFILTTILLFESHIITKNYIYTEPTSDFNLLGNMGKVDEAKAIEKTKRHNDIIEKMLKIHNPTDKSIMRLMDKSRFYKGITDREKKKDLKQIKDKYNIIKKEYFTWVELLISILIAILGYVSPQLILKFQLKMRQLEMENEVMQFHTLILMLMKIERINVEMMLEWLERYSNIFKPQISKCVNNFEAGPYEALEQLKNDVTFPQFIRIVEGLQAAVEQIPIVQAFDEIDTERTYYQEKRKDSNEILIKKKTMIGKAIGFAPMVVLFVGYLIAPMVGIGIISMSEALEAMQNAEMSM